MEQSEVRQEITPTMCLNRSAQARDRVREWPYVRRGLKPVDWTGDVDERRMISASGGLRPDSARALPGYLL
jgi:hypothetical protein